VVLAFIAGLAAAGGLIFGAGGVGHRTNDSMNRQHGPVFDSLTVPKVAAAVTPPPVGKTVPWRAQTPVHPKAFSWATAGVTRALGELAPSHAAGLAVNER